MSAVGQREILTQKSVVEFLRDTLGYRYLGSWKNRDGNTNVEVELLTRWLRRQGHDDKVINRVLHEVGQATAVGGGRPLYDANRAFYGLLRYGVRVLPDVGEQMITVWLIDWKNPANNDFSFAEEVTIAGENTKRPDLVLYLNGIAVAVIELKRSTVSVSEGIRQSIDSQKKEFIRSFYATVQLLMAGNDTEGLRYGLIETPEKYWLRWKEAADSPSSLSGGVAQNQLLRELGQLCWKERFLEIIHDFMVFDAGIKKVCRHNQYFGVKAAQARVRRREGGILWHTQGSGKSLIMVWLAKWIRENITNGRVLITTDRNELDEQIEKVFLGVEESIYRTKSGADLMRVLNASEEWLVCSLIHKFGSGEEASEKDIDEYIKELQQGLPPGFHPKGEVFVFVDECHRTQSGKLHAAMKALLPGAMFIGFTGTPLLKADKPRSIETFGPYIHTYKYDEAVRDKVVLDLRYEARDINQVITAQDKVDQWFDAKTRGLTDTARAQIKKRWGTMQAVLSARDRLHQIVADIMFDMETRDRLMSGYGNALLVCDSIYNACRIYEMFTRTGLAGKCAIVTSYRPAPADLKGEDAGEGKNEKLQQYAIYRRMLAEYFDEPEDTAMHRVEEFEKAVRKRFVNEPGQMKLLIVVDMLLTGFDAPSATYLYIDKHMQDHGLFQAICRVNRLDGVDKEYGYIVDYKDLFRSLETAIKDYTGEAFSGYDKEDVAGLLQNRLDQGRERLDEAREAIKALCEPVGPVRDSQAYRHYFCAKDSGNADQLAENAPKRAALYSLSAAFLRAYANLANEMQDAGYTAAEAEAIKGEVVHYEKVREEIKLASGDYVDMKLYEPAMRHLLDTFIKAEDTEKLSALDDMSLVELVIQRGEKALESLPDGLQRDREAVAETIENNVRRLIIDEMPVNPRYYERMSALLDALIEQRRREALDYRAYLAKIEELARQVRQPEGQSSYPQSLTTPVLRALYDNLPARSLSDQEREAVAVGIDSAILRVKKADWRGNRFKRLEVRNAIASVLGVDDSLVDLIFEIIVNQRDY